MRARLTYANVMATIAVFIALGGASYAALKLPKNSVGTKQIKKNAVSAAKIKKAAVTTAKLEDQAVTGAKVKNGSLTGAQVDASTLGTVPNAENAQTAGTASSIVPPENWHEVGAPGEPGFQNGWENYPETTANVAFYKDHEGVVHLTGEAQGGSGFKAIFQLPPGYRPAKGAVLSFPAFCLSCSSDVQSVIIAGPEAPGREDGQVDLGSAGEDVSFYGISFRAES